MVSANRLRTMDELTRCRRAAGRVSTKLLGALVAALLAFAAIAWWLGARQAASNARAERSTCALPALPAGAAHAGKVWVPGGRFELGDTVYREEQPLRDTTVTGFWMDRTEVTNEQFAAFVRATGHVTTAERPVDTAAHPGLPPALQQPGAVVFTMPNDVQGRGDLTQWWRYVPGASWRHPGGPGTSIEGRGAWPVVAVTRDDALAYAKWAGATLPTEAQWEWAARAARAAPPPSHEQPRQANTWQGLFPVINSADDGFVGLAPVGCYEPNALGLFDMIGNAWELTLDAWTADHTSASPPDAVPADLRRGASAQVVIKGGSFLCAPNYCMRYRAGARQAQDADLGTSHVGFRTVLLAPGP
jgi:sulfatase modifying factor 1